MRGNGWVVLATLLAAPAAGQWQLTPSGTSTEFRGLSAVSARVVWAAGRGGVVARTTDGGARWTSDSIPGASGLFLIAVHGRSAREAWVLGTAFSGPSDARIYHTTDGGRSWQLQYANSSTGIFFDGMAFWDGRQGIAFSDPQNGRFVIVRTRDGGVHWTPIPPERIPVAPPGEAAFAASGTAIAVHGRKDVWIATGGGPRARVFHSGDQGDHWTVAETPASGGPAKGLFGLAWGNGREGVAVGGDYQRREESVDNLFLTEDAGKTWRPGSSAALSGVQYGIAAAGDERYLAVGPPGSALSRDRGRTWERLSGPGFNTVSCAGGTCWAAGVEGRIGRISPLR